MDDGYLPDYYIRKKQRDRMYTNAWRIVCGVAVVIAAVFVGNFAFNSFGITLRNKGLPAVNEKHADELDSLKTEQRISDGLASQHETKDTELSAPESTNLLGSSSNESGNAADPPGAAGAIHADLASIDYSESFPLVSVSLESGNKDSDSNSGAAGASTPPASPQKPAADTKGSETENSQDADSAKAQDKPKEETPEVQSKPVLSNKIYHIYVAEVRTREEADNVNSKLAEHGYKGQIVEQKPNFLVKVMETSRGDEALALVEKLRELGFEPITTRSSKK
jgi:cell division septation protein DedD